MLEETIELMAESAQAKGLDLVGAAIPSGVHGDPGGLLQVLSNLLSNAIKFTERGEVSVQVSLLEAVKATLCSVSMWWIPELGLVPSTLINCFTRSAKPMDLPREMRNGIGVGDQQTINGADGWRNRRGN